MPSLRFSLDDQVRTHGSIHHRQYYFQGCVHLQFWTLGMMWYHHLFLFMILDQAMFARIYRAQSS